MIQLIQETVKVMDLVNIIGWELDDLRPSVTQTVWRCYKVTSLPDTIGHPEYKHSQCDIDISLRGFGTYAASVVALPMRRNICLSMTANDSASPFVKSD